MAWPLWEPSWAPEPPPRPQARTPPSTHSASRLQSYGNVLELEVFHLRGHHLPGWAQETPSHLSMAPRGGRQLSSSPWPEQTWLCPQTCLLTPDCRAWKFLAFLLEQERLGRTQSHRDPVLMSTHSSPEARNGQRARPVGVTVCPSLPGTKWGWGVPGTQDSGLKPGSSQANLDELVTLLSKERPGQVDARAETLLPAGA